MSVEPSPGSLEDILGVWDEQGPFPLRDKGDVALLVNEIKRLRAELADRRGRVAEVLSAVEALNAAWEKR